MATMENQCEDLYEYPFELTEIPRLRFDDPQAERLISNQKPVVITGTNLVNSALHWDLDYLRSHIGDSLFTVYQSNNNYFRYYESTKISTHKDFKPPTLQKEMTFPEFVNKLKECQRTGTQKVYLQQLLSESVGERIIKDFISFNWNWIRRQKAINHWGPLSSNLLLVGMEGNITSVHYDEQQNFFAQVRGNKRCLLFAPDQFKCLYPYPVHHPHDRQSQVNLENLNLKKFPKAAELKGMQTIMEPGDVLYIPVYWWHQIESLPKEGPTISINFWYKVRNYLEETIPHPLNISQKIAIMRNIEKMITDALGDVEEVAPFMQSMVLGRYT